MDLGVVSCNVLGCDGHSANPRPLDLHCKHSYRLQKSTSEAAVFNPRTDFEIGSSDFPSTMSLHLDKGCFAGISLGDICLEDPSEADRYSAGRGILTYRDSRE